MAILLVVVGLALYLLTSDGSISLASFGPISTWATALGVLSLVAATVLAAVRPAVGSAPLVLGGIAVTWVAPVIEGWSQGPELIRTVAAASSPLVVPLLTHLALLDATGRVRDRWRVPLVAVWSLSAICVFVITLVRDPLFDLACWSNCTANSFLVAPAPGLASGLVMAQSWLEASVGILTICWIVVVGLGRAANRPAAVRRILPLGAVLVFQTATAVTEVLRPAARLDTAPLPALYVASSIALIAVASGWISSVAIWRARRAAALRLIDDLALPGVSWEPLETKLAARLGDPGLKVLYPVPGKRGWFDAAGVEHPIPATAFRALTEIRRDDALIALVVHDRSLLNEKELGRRIGAAAALAVDNERLRAGILMQLAELQESRVRIVESADWERRRIERNLHDGAQQSLLVLQFELSLAHSQIVDAATSAALVRVIGEVRSVTDNLRQMAHGIFPAVLNDVGLDAALRHLAEDAPVPLSIDVGFEGRFAPSVERLVYLVVRTAVAAATASDDAITARIDRSPDGIRMVVSGAPVNLARNLVDRVGALGGTISVSARRMEAVVPCE
ncbi:MAG: histidine kinase [Microbacteriaceae bacterium]|nr:histidine kinase [Microbacteriaceae bacterium]